MKKTLLFISMCVAIVATAQTTNWQQVGDSIEYLSQLNSRVGIRTTNPLEALHVNGYVRGDGGHGSLRIRTECGVTSIGCDSWAYSHFNTNMPRFYFYKPIMIGDGELSSGNGKDMTFKTYNGSNYTTRMFIKYNSGYVGIGTTTPAYKLDVNGKIHASDSIIASYLNVNNGAYFGGQLRANYIQTNSIYPMGSYLTLQTSELRVPGTIKAKEVIVNTTGADFVFDKDYKLPTLKEVKTYIEQNQHLPEIPSASEMLEEGVSLDKLVIQLLQKVEELTLYTIQQEERIKELENNQR